MTRVYNFSAGPAAIPEVVLQRIRDDIPDWAGTGMSIMEVSHRGREFVDLAATAEKDLRELLRVPEDYSVLFLQGGATLQFSMVPLNLAKQGEVVDYVQTGSWSRKAIAEARRYCRVNVIADSADRNFTYIPDQDSWQNSADAAYVHYCANETIAGVEFPFVPETGDTPTRFRHVQYDSVPAAGREPFWRHLCRRAEKHRSSRHYTGYRSQRFAGQGTRYDAQPHELRDIR